MLEKQITSIFLAGNIKEVLAEIENEETIFIVTTEAQTFSGDDVFVLGPPAVCGLVLGLIDEEYGWPITVRVEDIDDSSDLMPFRRGHPFITIDDKVVAVAVQMDEYELIKKKIQNNDVN